MAKQRQLRAEDGFAFGVYESLPNGKPRGSCIVIQEIFGVNSHIRAVTDRFAQEGYASLAPQIFDRAERDVELGYSDEDLEAGFRLAFQETDRAETLQVLQAVIEEAGKYGKNSCCRILLRRIPGLAVRLPVGRTARRGFILRSGRRART